MREILGARPEKYDEFRNPVTAVSITGSLPARRCDAPTRRGVRH